MCPNKATANKIVDVLLKKKFIACANILPGVTSKYWWKGKIEKSDEVLVMMKTRRTLFGKVKKEIKSLHPYDVPEVICVRIAEGSKNYLKWIKDVTK
jgi:periplasmic divalent cation tolerance protein